MQSITEISNNIIKNVKNSFSEYDIDHDSFMRELSKYGGVIAGSFMYMNFVRANTTSANTTSANIWNINDIDIYICDKTDRSKITEKDYYHEFEKYIMRNISNDVKTTDSYIFTDGIILSRTFVCKKIALNVILLNEPVVNFINENFDLDCCKIIYDGKSCQIYNLDDLSNGVSGCKYNKCSLKHVYQNHEMYWNLDVLKYWNSDVLRNRECATSIYSSDAFMKFKKLFQTYLDKKKGIVDVNCRYRIYLKLISRQMVLDDVFEGVTLDNIDQIKMTDQIVKTISMIRTHERIDKYKQRGIKLVKLQTDCVYL